MLRGNAIEILGHGSSEGLFLVFLPGIFKGKNINFTFEKETILFPYIFFVVASVIYSY